MTEERRAFGGPEESSVATVISVASMGFGGQFIGILSRLTRCRALLLPTTEKRFVLLAPCGAAPAVDRLARWNSSTIGE